MLANRFVQKLNNQATKWMLSQGSIPFRMTNAADFERSLRRFFCPDPERRRSRNVLHERKSRVLEMLMQRKHGFDRKKNRNPCRFFRPHRKYRFCVYAECPYEPERRISFRRSKTNGRKELTSYCAIDPCVCRGLLFSNPIAPLYMVLKISTKSSAVSWKSRSRQKDKSSNHMAKFTRRQ